MSGYQSDVKSLRDIELRARNRRTGFILASVALVFFIGVMLKYTLLR